MNRKQRTLFWIESALGGAAALGAVTSVWRDWIEGIFGADPDQHSGSVEWLIMGALLFSALALALLARREWVAHHTEPWQRAEAGWDATP